MFGHVHIHVIFYVVTLPKAVADDWDILKDCRSDKRNGSASFGRSLDFTDQSAACALQAPGKPRRADPQRQSARAFGTPESVEKEEHRVRPAILS